MQVAIVGLAIRVPGANNAQQYWQNLHDGVDSITRFSAAEATKFPQMERLSAGATEVHAGGLLDEPERFDAGFFGVSPKEAKLIDPQQRQLVEVAYEAFESAAVVPGSMRTGVFAGAGFPTYPMTHLWNSPDLDGMGHYWLTVGNDKDHIATRISYLMGLRGPTVAVQSACSTSLVCVHLACQSLLTGECDIAVAGSSAITFPQKRPYHVVEGGILALDGTCRPFDIDAAGTVPANGVAAVVLRRLSDAQADGDPIRAVIQGTAIGNDAVDRMSYSAPSVSGQAAVIAESIAVAGIRPDEVSYVEAHGTGTPLGDPIEIAALTRAMPGAPDQSPPCLLGSVKGNIGHVDVTAGLAGLIKTVLALEHQAIPASLHFQSPNPRLDLSRSRFRVAETGTPWPRISAARIAGVSSFGLGGTNAHVVVQEAPVETPAQPVTADRSVPLLLSADSPGALDICAEQLADVVDGDIVASARALAHGRRHRSHRRVVVADSSATARQKLRNERRYALAKPEPRIAFVFSGAGALPGQQATQLFDWDAFASAYHTAREAFAAIGVEVLDPASLSTVPEQVRARPTVTLPALFASQVALARLWESFGIQPAAVCGHSAGEYAAAHVAGALTLPGAAAMIKKRAQLLETTAPGRIAMVRLGHADAVDLAERTGVYVAAVNSADSCLVAGDDEHFAAMIWHAERVGIDTRVVAVATAAHTPLLRSAGAELAALAKTIDWRPPAIPYISGMTGVVTHGDEITKPEYWDEHLWRTVRFDRACAALGSHADAYVEIGPPGTVEPALRANISDAVVETSLPQQRETVTARARFLESLGVLWTHGADVAWDTAITRNGRRTALPSAPFGGRKYLPNPAREDENSAGASPKSTSWAFNPVWHRARTLEPTEPSGRWLVYDDGSVLADGVAMRLGKLGAAVERIAIPADIDGAADASARDRLIEIATEPWSQTSPVRGVVYFWASDSRGTDPRGLDIDARRAVDLGFAVPFAIAKAVVADDDGSTRLVAVAPGLVDAFGGNDGEPFCALVLGPFITASREHNGLSAVAVDADPSAADRATVDNVCDVITSTGLDEAVVVRGSRRWVREWERVDEPAAVDENFGVTVITGGLGGIGLAITAALVERGARKIALLSRRTLPLEAAMDAELRGLRALGVELITISVDIADAAQLSRAIETVSKQLGPVETMVHAAGVPGGGLIVSRSLDDCLDVLRPKVAGTRALVAALREHPVRRVLLCSALDGVLGTFGQVDHVAANCFLDSVAATDWFGGAVVTSIDWGAWREVGQAANLDSAGGLAQWRTEMLEQGIPPQRGAELACRLLGWPGIVAVSPRDIDELRSLARESDVVNLFSETAPTSEAFSPRPLSEDTYEVPSNTMEQMLAAMWSAVIGVAPVGIHDDYFALGGHSLAAIALVSRLRLQFKFRIGLTDVLNRPTVAAQAQWLADQLDHYIDGLTDDEVGRLLAEEPSISMGEQNVCQ